MRFPAARKLNHESSSETTHYHAPERQEVALTNQEIGEKVRVRRRKLRLRRRDLAELSGVTLRSLTGIENGSANPTINQLAKIAEVLGLELRLTEKSLNASS
ncbi:helix-turn-helix domain-containing protein [Singulisphaera sp. GP187]|uniref:helix-turn-helix domain-containing protein n=1 Tax=Singulisphaera sp. GP187 TaxID=1882752 RepID=UPI0009FB09D4|nr:helix-turn-helix domain-containing protein [Singulisphaera sp. GP187]